MTQMTLGLCVEINLMREECVLEFIENVEKSSALVSVGVKDNI